MTITIKLMNDKKIRKKTIKEELFLFMNHKAFFKNHNRKTMSVFVPLTSLYMFIILLFISVLLKDDSLFIVLVSILLGLATLTYLLYTFMYIRTLKLKCPCDLQVNENGVGKLINNNGNKSEINMNWSSLKKIIVSRYSILFLGDLSYFSVPISIYEELLKALKKYKHENLICYTKSYDRKEI